MCRLGPLLGAGGGSRGHLTKREKSYAKGSWAQGRCRVGVCLNWTDTRHIPTCAGETEVRLWLTIFAYNLGNLWRRLVLPQRIEKWSLTSLQQRLVKRAGDWRNMAATIGYCWPRAI